MRLPRPFIRLPLAFDAARLAAEAAALPAAAWMPHPSGMPGNSAVALISRGGGDNDDFVGPMAPTAHLAQCPYHRQVMATLGEVLARSRLMRLEPGSEVSPHVDFNYHWRHRVRMHVPVVTNPAVAFHCGAASVHMRAGECWIFDNWRPHRVVNAGNAARIHLVIDLTGSSRFWRLVEQAQANGPAHAAGARPLAYEPGREPALETEQHVAAPVMAPGEVEAIVADIIADFSANPENDPALAERYRRLLRDFALDWRVLWHRHGIGRDGLRHYRRLLDAVGAQLHPDRRALVTASNGIGVNPVIVQRLLRAALDAEVYEHFVAGAAAPAPDQPA